jgi:hypothetical protein
MKFTFLVKRKFHMQNRFHMKESYRCEIMNSHAGLTDGGAGDRFSGPRTARYQA